MGRRKFKFTCRKNEERKRYAATKPQTLPISIPFDQISSPVDSLSLQLSFPLSVFLTTPVRTLTTLQSRLKSCEALPADSGVSTFRILNDFSWVLLFASRCIQPAGSTILRHIPSTLTSVAEVANLVETLEGSEVCPGNPDPQFSVLHPQFQDQSGILKSAVVDTTLLASPTIRHRDCELLVKVKKAGDRCTACHKHRDSLRKMLHRRTCRSSEVVSSPSSHANYRYLQPSEKDDRMRSLHSLYRNTKSRLERLRVKIAHATASNGVQLDDNTHADLVSIAKANTEAVQKGNNEDSFQRVFWEEQVKASRLSDARQMRWHPLFVKWCLFLRHQSSSAYETLRQSGCVKLPSQRTLRDYTHYVRACVGFSSEVDRQLLDLANYQELKEWQKCVVLVIDEMHIKEDLVYDKHTGALIGFTNLGTINEHLLKLERSMDGDSKEMPTLANSMLVFMVRGLFTSLEFPYAQFPCKAITGDQLFNPFWEAVGRLERSGFKVLASTFDGASVNRRLVKIHDIGTQEVVHKVVNLHAEEERYIFFFSDPPHLLKTVRNCWASKTRRLWNGGKEIKWSHPAALYFHDSGARKEAPGLALLPKLKYEHIILTSFSKMRVDLAAQVLSGSVSKALEMTGGEDAQETAKFTSMFDRFFDSLNVTNFTNAKKKRKVFKSPYYSASDFRLKWLEEDFLGYLDRWESSVARRPGHFKPSVRKRMLISSETRLGLRMTVKSFVELVRYIFTIEGVKVFLSEKLSQDPIEKIFGCQRQRGGAHENPNAQEFMKNTQALRVIDSFCRDTVRGNCRGNTTKRPLDKENTPLPKRRRKHK